MAVMTALTIAQLGLSVAEGIGGARSTRDSAKEAMKSIERQIDLIEKQKRYLQEASRARKSIARDKYGADVTSLVDRIGMSLEKSGDQFRHLAGRTGMSYSGTVERKGSQAREEAYEGFSNTIGGLSSQRRATEAELDMNLDEALNSLTMQINQLNQEKKLYKEQSKQKFLGIF